MQGRVNQGSQLWLQTKPSGRVQDRKDEDGDMGVSATRTQPFRKSQWKKEALEVKGLAPCSQGVHCGQGSDV